MDIAKNIKVLFSQLEDFSDRPNQIRIIAEYILREMNARKIGNSISSHDLYQAYLHVLENYTGLLPNIPKSTFIVELSKLSSSVTSNIKCPGRKQGYYIDEIKKGNNLNFDLKHYFSIVVNWYIQHVEVGEFYQLQSPVSFQSELPEFIGLIGTNPSNKKTVVFDFQQFNSKWKKKLIKSIENTLYSNESYLILIIPRNGIQEGIIEELKLVAKHFNIGVALIKRKDPGHEVVDEIWLPKTKEVDPFFSSKIVEWFNISEKQRLV